MSIAKHVRTRLVSDTFWIDGGEVRPVPFSRSGRAYRVDRVEIKHRDGALNGVTLRGQVLKKDGAESLNRADETFHLFNIERERASMPAWLLSLIDDEASRP